MEDRTSTATAAYRTIYRVAREELGPEAYLQERMGPGSDATLEFVSSVRNASDNNVLHPKVLERSALRWYKNRRLTNYDMDGKALLATGKNNANKLTQLQRRAVMTMSYTVSGRLLLTESFRLFDQQVLHDLSRIFPFHATTLSARPLDAFVTAEPPAAANRKPSLACPTVFDFEISKEWHQLVLYGKQAFSVPLSGDTALGALGLDAECDYHVYDFWNDAYVGKLSGDSTLQQQLEPGEARMLAIHAVQKHPQWISTDRHVMQGYVDLVKKPVWNESTRTLSGTAAVVGGEPYRITIARNGATAVSAEASNAEATLATRNNHPELIELVLESDENREVEFTVKFQ